MKKSILTLVICIGLVSVLPARDIKTKDGTVYKNVSISDVTPIGIDITYMKNGTGFIRMLHFTELSPEIQKEFNYSPRKAEIYLNNLRKSAERARKKYAERLKKGEVKTEKEDALISQIDAGAVNVVLKVVSQEPDGIIAWADLVNDTVDSSGHLGKVFVYGVMGLEGSEEARVIYPTGTYKDECPCYAGTLVQAIAVKKQSGN